MLLEVEAILEAAEIISKFPKDETVLREQKYIFDKHVDALIEATRQEIRANDYVGDNAEY